tara:strand:+ start:4374 stop:4919 length:546 start_codon:yes stop_codon:yes gene_type:complete
MHISLIQSSPTSIASVYILHNFLYSQEYLQSLTKLVREETLKSSKEKLGNVEALSTDWGRLLEIDGMKGFHLRILHTLSNIYQLRSPTPGTHREFSMTQSWGMIHKKGNLTHEHTHVPMAWSGAFYFDVPSTTVMNLPDFKESLELENNMLVLFPGTTKHGVSEHLGDKERISMAFNIIWK